MFDKVTLGIRGDLKPLKKRILKSPVSSFVSFTKNNGMDYIQFETKNDVSLLDQFLNVLAEYILDRYEPMFIRRLLREGFPTLSPAHSREVLHSVKLLDDDKEIGCRIRRDSVLLSLYDYLREDSVMLLDGFVAFRLKEYEAILETLTERLVEDSITKKEYEDFIGLLKYFVNIQENRPNLVHLVIAPDGSYALISENGENITQRCLADFIDSEDLSVSTNFDDLLISMLITLAPVNIEIHNAKQFRNKELLQTIGRVFDGHLTDCTGCDICSVTQVKTTKG